MPRAIRPSDRKFLVLISLTLLLIGLAVLDTFDEFDPREETFGLSSDRPFRERKHHEYRKIDTRKVERFIISDELSGRDAMFAGPELPVAADSSWLAAPTD